MTDWRKTSAELSIWIWAFGYFAAYVPYSALTKWLSSPGEGLTGVELLAGSTLASLATAALFLALTGWWRDARRARVAGLSIPVPSLWPALSGLCSAAIIATTTLSYTFSGASIVLMMLLMRGGVLVMAPVVDFLSGRAVRPRSWIALGLTLAGVLVATAGRIDLRVPLAAALDVAIYLAAYFVRLRLMSHAGKRPDRSEARRFFVEEQLVSSPAIVLFLALFALAGDGAIAAQLRQGYAGLLEWTDTGWVLAVGIASQGTGIFGALVLLDARENTFCVPVNRGSSILAGVVATGLLAAATGTDALHARELGGAALVLLAIAALALETQTLRTVAPMRRDGAGHV